MNIFDKIKSQVSNATDNLFNIIPNKKQLSVELTKNFHHGDLSTNVAMLLAKELKKSPLEIANLIKEELKKSNYIDEINVAAPGFININLKPETWYQVLESVIELGSSFGDSKLGLGEKVNIEFVSCNPTGPMHIGHSRVSIYGDALSQLMKKCGYSVTKEFYINDAGNQINVLAKSVYFRYLEALGESNPMPDDVYPGDYLIDSGKKLSLEYGDKLKYMTEEEKLVIIKEFSINDMMDLIKKDLDLLGVKHDFFFSEKQLHDQGKISSIVEELEKRGIVYKGVLAPPKGKITDDWEEREQLLFKTTECGDDIDRPLKKSNGDWTYAAADIAYMKNKIDRGFKKITMILGADHLGYKKRMEYTASVVGGEEVNFDIKICQLVNFIQDGKPFKMSKRQGVFITVEDVLKEVNKDIVRFIMLTRKNDQVLEFDFEKVKEQSRDNPAFYVQYANARVHSILRNANDQDPKYLERIKEKSYDLKLLNTAEDLHIIKLIASWPKVVELACIHQEPHRIAFFLIDLASEFHSFWSKGNENINLRFIRANEFEVSLSRLILAKAISSTIVSGLEVLNIKAIEQM